MRKILISLLTWYLDRYGRKTNVTVKGCEVYFTGRRTTKKLVLIVEQETPMGLINLN